MAITYEPIATTTLGGSATSIAFASIPSGYTDLRLIGSIFGDATGSWLIEPNYSSPPSLSGTYLRGNGSTVNSTMPGGWYAAASGYSTSTTIPTLLDLNLFNYTGSTNKTALYSVSNDKNGAGVVVRVAGLAQTTSAITSIRVREWTGLNLTAGTTLTLYGILKA